MTRMKKKTKQTKKFTMKQRLKFQDYKYWLNAERTETEINSLELWYFNGLKETDEKN